MSQTIHDQIIITAYIEDRDLIALYSGSVAFLCLSLYESFGLSPLEAMQCGTPVIYSSTPNLPEEVVDAGILVKPESQNGRSQEMLDLYQNNDPRRNIAQKSLAHKCLPRSSGYSRPSAAMKPRWRHDKTI